MADLKLKVIDIPSSNVKLSMTGAEIDLGYKRATSSRGTMRAGVARTGEDASAEHTSAFKGDGDLNLLCGRCGATLARLIRPGQVQDMILLCSPCGAFNDTENCASSDPGSN
jgi:hypothetical protein